MTVLKRVLIPLGELLVWLIVASFVVFALLSLLPGDVAQVILGANADPKAAATVRSRLGLDLPWPQRYWDWISSLVRGDLGTSMVSAEPIGPQIASRLAVTGWLVGLSLKHLKDASTSMAASDGAMQERYLPYLPTDLHSWVQSGHRFLENHSNTAAPKGRHGMVRGT